MQKIMPYTLRKEHTMEQKRADLVCEFRRQQRAGIEAAISECIGASVMSEFLVKNRDEVIELMLDEWNYDMALKIAADEAREKTLCKLVRDSYLTLERAAQFAGVTQAEFTDWFRQYDPEQRGTGLPKSCKRSDT